MREIKFRAWNLETRTMYAVEDINFRGSKTVILQHHRKQRIPLYSICLMQYTGAKDKNGVEIYEGDIIHWDPVHPIESYTPTYAKTKPLNDYIIQWNDARCEFWAEPRELGHAYSNISQADLSMNWKVIGNIYESPEFARENE